MLTIDARIKNLQFGVALTANTTPGIMGIGFPTTEAISPPYPNLIDQMFSQGLVESRTYSLYLNDLEASTGTIIFGGVDLQKFRGTLQTFPINADMGVQNFFYISLTELSLTPPGGCATPVGPSTSYPINGLLDSGTTDLILPTDIANAIAANMGASLDEFGNYNLPNCDLEFAPGSLNFDFSGVKINVPYSEFIQDDGDGNCFLGLGTNDAGCALLGDTFLRSTYVVYDLVVPYSSHSNSRIITRSHWHQRCSTPLQAMSEQFHRVWVRCLQHRQCQIPGSSKARSVNETSVISGVVRNKRY
jgi:hypothetical protein